MNKEQELQVKKNRRKSRFLVLRTEQKLKVKEDAQMNHIALMRGCILSIHCYSRFLVLSI